MKAAVILISILSFIGFVYSVSYATHYCTAEWHCSADIIMLMLGTVASIMGVFYALIELR